MSISKRWELNVLSGNVINGIHCIFLFGTPKCNCHNTKKKNVICIIAHELYVRVIPYSVHFYAADNL